MIEELKKHNIPPSVVQPNLLPFIGLLLGLFVWVTDSIVDVLLLEEEQGLIENLFQPDEPTELWMRTLVVIVFIIMGIYSRHLLQKQIQLDQLLMEYQSHLEEIVTERTQKLLDKTRELEVLANRDSLTQLLNRRKFAEVLQLEVKRFNRYGEKFALINIDIDHFKKVNDTYGHDVGDQVIKTFASTVESNIRASDSAARWGGEEFLILVIEADESVALKIAEKLRSTLKQTEIEPVGFVSASIGITQIRPGDTDETIIIRSDQALYQAKDNGRDRIEVI